MPKVLPLPCAPCSPCGPCAWTGPSAAATQSLPKSAKCITPGCMETTAFATCMEDLHTFFYYGFGGGVCEKCTALFTDINLNVLIY